MLCQHENFIKYQVTTSLSTQETIGVKELLAAKTANDMTLNHAARFFDPDAIWHSLENLPVDNRKDQLVERHIKRYGQTDLYLGRVTATGERALWLKFPGRHRETTSLTSLPDTLWVKTVEYSDHSLLTVVLTDLNATTAFSRFACALLDAFENSPNKPASQTLFALLRRWQPQPVESLRYAA